MRWRTPITATLLATLAIAAPTAAQAPVADAEILKQVADAYRSLSRYWFEGSIQVDVRSPKGAQTQLAPFLVAVDGKGRLRDEVTGGPASGMFLSDGRQVVTFNGALAQYTRQTGNVDSVLKSLPNKGVGGTLVTRYAGIENGVVSIKRLPEESLTLDGKPRSCDVLEVTYAPGQHRAKVTEDPRTYWIDRQTRMVLRQRSVLRADAPQYGGKVEQEELVTFRRAAIDPVLPESLWVFRAPEGVREVKEFQPEAKPDPVSSFAGKPAIDFTLKDLKGRAHTLKNLRGKTVLLDFWASWCGPCRITMPQVAKIHTQYKTRGVEVMSINVGENAKKAGDYMTKNGYGFTTLLDEDRSVSTQYKVNGIPTLVVIDAKGNVSDYLVGARDEAALVAALKKAGVK